MIDFEVKDREIIIKLGTWSARVREIIKKELATQSKYLTNYVITRHLMHGTTNDRLRVRTGHLRRTTRPKNIIDKGEYVEGGVAFGANYAGVHIAKQGTKTVIRPKVAKNLAIPIMSGLTPSGAAKALSPRDFPFLKLIVRPGRAPLLARVEKKGGKTTAIFPYYVLLKSVTVPARVHPENIIIAEGANIGRAIVKAVMEGAR